MKALLDLRDAGMVQDETDWGRQMFIAISILPAGVEHYQRAQRYRRRFVSLSETADELVCMTYAAVAFHRRKSQSTNIEIVDERTGKTEHFAGGLFDETVFNDSVREFLNKRDELADYFDESRDEDIFDYIPNQRTNQIFTPRWVVKRMVDELERENPGCFDDPTATFADLYMKSGIYITEIVKRLYASDGLRRAFPNDTDRICHIIEHQVYGMAPTRIIYLIATNYILGFDELMRATSTHFAQCDTAEAAKGGTLEQVVSEHFG